MEQNDEKLAQLRAMVGKQLERDADPVMEFLRAKMKNAKEENERKND